MLVAVISSGYGAGLNADFNSNVQSIFLNGNRIFSFDSQLILLGDVEAI